MLKLAPAYALFPLDRYRAEKLNILDSNTVGLLQRATRITQQGNSAAVRQGRRIEEELETSARFAGRNAFKQ